jgi:glycerate dehydrogenase
MKIVLLDGYTLNPGDLSWKEIQDLGECDIYDRSRPEEVLPRSDGAEILLTNKVTLGREQMEKLPKLRYIGVSATGYNIVDVVAARERKVVVTNVPSYGTHSVAQMTFALLLELTQHVGHHAETVRAGRWTRSPDFCYWDYPLVELHGLTLGVIGFGRIGQAVATIARGFGMELLAYTRTVPRPAPDGIRFVDLPTLFRQSDVVSLHCPLTAETKHLVDEDRLAMMKSSAFLVNTSRGPLIDEAALVKALNAGRLAGAGLDVLEVEPPVADNPLLKAKNCFVTPHISWATRAARARLMRAVVENVRAFLGGSPKNVVS